jgi:hypothetical protein
VNKSLFVLGCLDNLVFFSSGGIQPHTTPMVTAEQTQPEAGKK